MTIRPCGFCNKNILGDPPKLCARSNHPDCVLRNVQCAPIFNIKGGIEWSYQLIEKLEWTPKTAPT